MGKWVTAWAMAHTQASVFSLNLGGRTACMEIPVLLDGTKLRLGLSNRYGVRPVCVEHAALCVKGCAVPLTFAGKQSVCIAGGAELRSDSVKLSVEQGDVVEARLYYAPGQIPESGNAAVKAIHSTEGDFSVASVFPAEASEIWSFAERPFPLREPATTISALDVFTENGTAVAVLGDSNTFSGCYTEPLSRMLAPYHVALLNLGISGNRLLRDAGKPVWAGVFGKAAKTRAEWDLFGHFGIETVLLNVGANDIFQPGTFAADESELCTVEELQAANCLLAEQCQKCGMRVLGATLVPCASANNSTEEKRQIADAYNHWVRRTKLFDAVIDFNTLLADPSAPNTYLPAYDSGDHLHFNTAGGMNVARQTAALFL